MTLIKKNYNKSMSYAQSIWRNKSLEDEEIKV